MHAFSMHTFLCAKKPNGYVLKVIYGRWVDRFHKILYIRCTIMNSTVGIHMRNDGMKERGKHDYH